MLTVLFCGTVRPTGVEYPIAKIHGVGQEAELEPSAFVSRPCLLLSLCSLFPLLPYL